jgi:lipoprotein-releasing system permease protein
MRRGANIALGIALIVVGAAITGISYVNAPYSGGRYVITSGLFIVGILRIVRGIFWSKDSEISRENLPEGQPWSLGEALGMALTTGRKKWARLALLYLPVPLVAAAAGYAAMLYTRTTDMGGFGGAGRSRTPLLPVEIGAAAGVAAGWIVGVIVMAPILRTCLAALREPDEAALASPPGGTKSWIRFVPRLFAFAIFYLLFAVVTAPLLCLPAIPFVLTPFFIVDQDLSLVSAMRKSWRASSAQFGKLWLYHFAFVPLLLFGSATGIGSALTVPLFFGGLGYAYARMSARYDLPWIPPEAGSRSIRTFLKVSLLALLALFGGLIFWVQSLPTLRGSAWNIRDAIIRAGAIVAGVAVVIVTLALLLPYMLDQLEGRRFTSFVAARHVRSQKSGFLTVISVLSICGVAISSCALSSVVSVMGGFSQDLKRKILGNNAHIVVDTTPGTPFSDYEPALQRIRKIPGVVGATPVVHGEVMASSASNLAGVIVTGIEPQSIHSVIDLAHNIEVGRLNYLEHPELLTKLPAQEVIGIGPGGEQYYKGAELPGLPDDIDPSVRAVIMTRPDRPGVILGRELAKTLHVYIGDEVTLVSPLGDLGPMGVMPRTKKFRVAAIFYSGMYEYDATYVYTMMDIAQEYFQTAGKISAIEVKVDDAERAEGITPRVVTAVARDDLRVRDWREINKNLFSALKLERFATFIILSVAIMVASFCIVCTLLLMVTEKGKEIAILKAIGASDGAILRTFIIEGMIIGGIGTVFGVVTGLSVCTGLSWFGLRLDPEVYYIDRLPISVNPGDFLTVALAALTICTLSTLYPAYAASRLRPVDGLRDA